MKKIIAVFAMVIVVFTLVSCTKQKDNTLAPNTTRLFWRVEGHELSGAVYYTPVVTTIVHN